MQLLKNKRKKMINKGGYNTNFHPDSKPHCLLSTNVFNQHKHHETIGLQFEEPVEELIEEAGEEVPEQPPQKKVPPPGHYSWKRPKAFIDTDLESDHDPKEKQNREFWDKQNIYNVSQSVILQIPQEERSEAEQLDQEFDNLDFISNGTHSDLKPIASTLNNGIFEEASSEFI